MNYLEQHIRNRLGNSIHNLDMVLAQFKELHYKRNQLLLTQGDICRYVYFVAQGCLQVFVYDNNGNENTRDIVIEQNWCSDLISFGTGNPSLENIRTVEPCLLYAIDKVGFEMMVQTVPQFEQVYRQVLEASYANSVYRINSFVAMDGLARIKWLMQNRPQLMTRLSSKLIASYLGISQETFSRLKAKL